MHYDRLKQYRCREQTSVRINETRRQSKLEETSFVEEVDDDFSEIEVEEGNEPESDEQKENCEKNMLRQWISRWRYQELKKKLQ